jgi:hypothetical protein
MSVFNCAFCILEPALEADVQVWLSGVLNGGRHDGIAA